MNSLGYAFAFDCVVSKPIPGIQHSEWYQAPFVNNYTVFNIPNIPSHILSFFILNKR